MIRTIISIITIVSLCLLVLLLNITTPSSAGPFGILVIFIFAYLSLVGVFAYFLYLGGHFVARFSVTVMSRKPFEILSFKRSYYYSTVLAAAPIMLVGLQSVGSIGVYEVLLIIGFEIIGCLYVSKRIN